MKKAFTLAETLITLGIIGVVAAVTIPSLVTKYQQMQTVTQLRKLYSDLNNAVKMSEIDNGSMADWEYVDGEGNYGLTAPFVKKYYQPYFKGSRVLRPTELAPLSKYQMIKTLLPNTYLVLNNGVIMEFHPHINNYYFWLIADLNGMKGPNKVGRDIFVFDAYKYADTKNQYKIKFWYYKDNELYSGSQYSCNKDNTHHYANFYCGKVIELNGWKIPKDYPW